MLENTLQFEVRYPKAFEPNVSMDAGLIEIELFSLPDGKEPFAVWCNKIKDPKARARIWARVTRVQLGNFGDCEPVGHGVFELRIHYGPGYRVYFAKETTRLVVLLWGGNKDTQEEDIRYARRLWTEYKGRQ